MASERAILIAIEGIDGAGKTTQVGLLKESLAAAGLDVVASREPTAGPHGQAIRESAVSGRLKPEEELHLFTQDRREHVANVITPALEAGKIVILDRYYYSTIAYQGARGADLAAIRSEMESFAPVPDAVFLIDIDPTEGLRRIADLRGEAPNAFETAANLTAVRDVFRNLADANIIRIDGRPPADEVHAKILEAVVEGPLKQKLHTTSLVSDRARRRLA